MPCIAQIAVQQRMNHPLTAAPGAIPTGERAKQTARHKPRSRGIHKVVDHS